MNDSISCLKLMDSKYCFFQPQGDLRLFSCLFIDLKAHRARILEVTVEFQRYVKASVLIFVDVYKKLRPNLMKVQAEFFILRYQLRYNLYKLFRDETPHSLFLYE